MKIRAGKPKPAEILSEAEQVEAAWRALSQQKFMPFVYGVKIDASDGARCFGSVIAEYQQRAFAEAAPSLEALQRGERPPIQRFWWERTKKAGKDSDLAICLLWLIAFARRPLFLQAAAADRDQANIVKKRLEVLLYHNEWLQEFVVYPLKHYKVQSRNGLATLEIVATDVGGSHGETPDMLVINELTHITKWEFVENLMDNADGVPNGVVMIATNAGFRGTKAEIWKHNAMRDDKWAMQVWQHPAPWIPAKFVRDAKARNSKSRFLRLWHGIWASGKGDALDPRDIEFCLSQAPGPDEVHVPGWQYLVGVDLGVSHDHAGIAVVAVHIGGQRIRVAQVHGFAPAEDGEVDLMEVETKIREINKKFRPVWIGYDPAQAKLMAQRLSRRGCPMHEVKFSGQNLTKMAQTLVQTISARRLEAFDDPEGRLRRDLGKFTIAEKSYGYKLEATSDEYGHADVGTALVICLPQAVKMLDGVSPEIEGPLVHVPGENDEPDEEERSGWSEELREIYEMHAS